MNTSVDYFCHLESMDPEQRVETCAQLDRVEQAMARIRTLRALTAELRERVRLMRMTCWERLLLEGSGL
ncbi:MAG: hypothetical protein ACHREM_22530 [Polyangiales bacterium]